MSRDAIKSFIEYQRTGRPEALDAALAGFQDAVNSTPPGHPDRAAALSNLGAALLTRFERSGDSADLDAAIDAGRQAVDLTPPGRPDVAGYVSNLGSSLLTRFERSGDSADLDAAIDAGRQAVDLTPPGHRDRAAIVSNLGNSLLTRFQRSGDSADLDAAIDAGRQAVDLTPPGRPDVAGYLSNLGSSLLTRFERSGDSADLDAAIDAGRQAVDLTPPGHRDRAKYVSNLGSSLLTRFERSGDSADLDAAIDAGRQAVDLTPPGHPDVPRYVSNLGSSLLTRFQRSGDSADLDAAIDAGRQAVDLTPPGHPDRAAIVSNLGNSLLTRFQRSGDSADLDAAIDAGRQAVDLTPPGHPDVPRYVSNLGNSLLTRFQRSGDSADLDAAIDAGQQAVAATPPGHPDRAAIVSNLGNSLLTRFQRSGDSADLDAAIDAGRQAVDLTPPGQPGRAALLTDLGTALRARFGLTAEPALLEEAIQAARDAVSATPGDHPDRAARLVILSALLIIRSEQGGGEADFNAAIAQWRQAADLAASPLQTRLDAAKNWATAAFSAGRVDLALEGYIVTVELLTELAWRASEDSTSDLDMRQWTHLTADATACAVLADRPELAVELMDHMRSVLWSEVLGLRRQLTQPAGRASDVAQRFFLTRRPYADLSRAAKNGSIILLNASSYGCHALVIAPSTSAVRVINLPQLRFDDALERANRLIGVLVGAHDNTGVRVSEAERDAVLEILDWLWEVIASPVLDALGHTGPHQSDSMWPRIWWCPTGPLTMLPVHAAAANYRSDAVGALNSVPDRVVSSYTSTIAALLQAQDASSPPIPRQLAVAMAKTPGLPSLPGVAEELAVLVRHLPPQAQLDQLIGPEATRVAVQKAIANHSWVHLACHARQHPSNPASSGFVLWDGLLTITQLANLQYEQADLAFLSACQTATSNVRLLNEPMHLAGLMQLLGYRHVISTMWTTSDRRIAQIADTVYSELMKSEVPSTLHAAEAVHHAAQALRQTDPADPLLWASYAHFGQ